MQYKYYIENLCSTSGHLKRCLPFELVVVALLVGDVGTGTGGYIME